MSNLLQGTNLAPLNATKVRALIGKRVIYLRKADIDHSGRGYFFPKSGKVIGQLNKNLEMDYENNYIFFSDIAEIVVQPDDENPL